LTSSSWEWKLYLLQYFHTSYFVLSALILPSD
jgi:hypothetical protein